MKRRQFIRQTGALSLGAALFPHISCATGINNPNILVISGWQDVNIGDIAHTPGVMHILEEAFPEATIVLWKRSRSDRVEELLRRNFPKINIVHGDVDSDRNVTTEEAIRAMDRADIDKLRMSFADYGHTVRTSGILSAPPARHHQRTDVL